MSTSPPPRRGWLLAAGAGALLAGAGLSWYRLRPGTPDDDALARLWALELETPSGSHLPLQAFRGRPLVVNFWATWCPPCVKELPALDEFAAAQAGAGWQVLGLAVDQLDAVRGFLATAPVRFPVALAGVDGLAVSRALGNANGALPFTVVVSGSGAVVERKLGATDPAELADWARRHGQSG